jgi:hypothetical protein
MEEQKLRTRPTKAELTNAPKAANDEEERVSLTTAVQAIVVANPSVSPEGIAGSLFADGWDESDIHRRMSSIVTIRTDTLAVLRILRSYGWMAPNTRV